jgi:hypothetical protein
MWHRRLHGYALFWSKRQKLTSLLAPPPPNHLHRHDVLHKHKLRKTHPTQILLNQIRQNLYPPPSLHAVIYDHQYLVALFAFPTLPGPMAISLKPILILAPFLLLSWPSMHRPRDEGLLRMRRVKTLKILWVALAQLHPVP